MADNEYIYGIIDNETDARQCAQLLAEEFAVHNPITVFEKATSARFFDETSWPIARQMFPEHLSVFARKRSINEIVGAIIAGDLYLEQEQEKLQHDCGVTHSIPIDSLLEELTYLFIERDFGQELKPNMVLYIELCGMRSQYSGKGIAHQMLKMVFDQARNKGFQYVLAQVTHKATQHIFINKMGGKELSVIDPQTWAWKNEDGGLMYPFKDYQGGPVPNILVKL